MVLLPTGINIFSTGFKERFLNLSTYASQLHDRSGTQDGTLRSLKNIILYHFCAGYRLEIGYEDSICHYSVNAYTADSEAYKPS